MPPARQNPLALFTSLRLTVVLLLLSIVLVFAATIDQVHLGVWGVQEKYFRSFFVFLKVPGTAFFFPVFPGGYLLGGVLIVNLIAAHIGPNNLPMNIANRVISVFEDSAFSQMPRQAKFDFGGELIL